jgi:glycosyltransferase involved in cell wall biosynthesis
VVGINAQISPRYPGGSETMALSLIRKLGETAGGERFVLCSVPKHADELLPYVGEKQQILRWPFRQVGFPYAMPPGGLWSRLRERSGQLRGAVEAVYRGYRDLRFDLPREPPARRVDPVLRAQGVRVVHFPFSQGFRTRLPFIYEPWDLQHLHHPEFFPPDYRRWRDRLYRGACQRARLVVTATRWVKQDVVRQYGIDPRKVAVIPRSSLLARTPLPDEERQRIWTERGIPEDYAFYPAMTFPHKNHLRLLQALALLRDRGLRLPLVCSGRVYEPHWPVVQAEVARLRLEGQVLFLGVVSEGMLASLFRRARFLVFPSLFEGLGAPILEAMHLDLPVLASDATCIPEVVGDAAWLFDGGDVEAIAATMQRAITDGTGLDALRARARTRLQRFSWERAAEAFRTCYRAAAGWPLSSEQGALLEEAVRA